VEAWNYKTKKPPEIRISGGFLLKEITSL
jgi:hypothetical protein